MLQTVQQVEKPGADGELQHVRKAILGQPQRQQQEMAVRRGHQKTRFEEHFNDRDLLTLWSYTNGISEREMSTFTLSLLLCLR